MWQSYCFSVRPKLSDKAAGCMFWNLSMAQVWIWVTLLAPYYPVANYLMMLPLCLIHLLAYVVTAELAELESHGQVFLHAETESKSVILFQLGTLPSRIKPTNATDLEPTDVMPKSQHVSLAGILEKASRKVAVALGVTDIISLCVLGLVVLLALYFVWGGTVDNLKENPYGELKHTGERAGREAQEKFQKWQEQQRQGGSPPGSPGMGSPAGMSPTDPFATQPEGIRRQFQGCCWELFPYSAKALVKEKVRKMEHHRSLLLCWPLTTVNFFSFHESFIASPSP